MEQEKKFRVTDLLNVSGVGCNVMATYVSQDIGDAPLIYSSRDDDLFVLAISV